MRWDHPQGFVVLLHLERHWLLALGIVLGHTKRGGLQRIFEF